MTANDDLVASWPGLRQWGQWLQMPDCCRLDHWRIDEEPLTVHTVRMGHLKEPETWPRGRRPRIYLALDANGPAYVGQTTDVLANRIRRHLGAFTTTDARIKAETWTGVVSVGFSDLPVSELNRLERSAADWLLPWERFRGRRHPTTR